MRLRMRLGLYLEPSRGGVMHSNYFSSLVSPFMYICICMYVCMYVSV
jgi:hypothetical protein